MRLKYVRCMPFAEVCSMGKCKLFLWNNCCSTQLPEHRAYFDPQKKLYNQLNWSILRFLAWILVGACKPPTVKRCPVILSYFKSPPYIPSQSLVTNRMSLVHKVSISKYFVWHTTICCDSMFEERSLSLLPLLSRQILGCISNSSRNCHLFTFRANRSD